MNYYQIIFDILLSLGLFVSAVNILLQLRWQRLQDKQIKNLYDMFFDTNKKLDYLKEKLLDE